MKRILFSILIAAVFLTGCSISANGPAQTDPFGHIYRAAEAIISEDSSADFLVNLDAFHNLWIMEDTTTYVYDRVGELKENKSIEGDTQNISWSLADDDTPLRYELTAAGDSVVLSQLYAEQVRWSYALARVDLMSVTVSSFGKKEHLEIDWYFPGTFPGDLSQLSSGTIPGKGKIGFSIEDDSADQITIVEEYYTNGNAEYAEYQLTKEEGFSISVSTRYDDGEQYAIYRMPYDDGEYVFYVRYC